MQSSSSIFLQSKMEGDLKMHVTLNSCIAPELCMVTHNLETNSRELQDFDKVTAVQLP